ncbi:MAG TPA: hypothetical protein VFJ06_01470 [Halococcus sp.]|nr:hypothetical protein [Halococcus sp.]
MGTSRRAALKALGVAVLGSGVAYGALSMDSSSDADTETGNETTAATTTATVTPTRTATQTATQTPEPSTWRLTPLAHSTLSSSVGGFSEGVIRADGRYAAVGTRFSGTGSYLVDVRDPHAPELVHHLPADDGVTCLDVKFGPQKGLYCRSNHPAGGTGVEIVDYGFAAGTPRSPRVIGALNAGGTHNLCVRSDESLVYTVNYSGDPGEPGMDIWDVSNPHSPRRLGGAGPPGAMHDVVYDSDRKLLHCTYMGDLFDGYVLLDASNPPNATEVGRFDYDEHTSYDEVEVGEEAFGGGHYALPYPERDLVLVGDERPYGVPGGKHVFDIGWRDGSPENPIPVGFTVSPNAQYMNSNADDDDDVEKTNEFDWTGHQFDMVPLEDALLLTSGDWHEGTVLYNIDNPTNPHPIDVHKTDKNPVPHPNEQLQAFGGPPMAYSSDYNAKHGFALTSDLFTGIYTYDIDGISGPNTGTEISTPETDSG